MAGYSGKSLVSKLGIKDSQRVVLINTPRGYKATLGKLPEGARMTSRPGPNSTFIHFFCLERMNLLTRFPLLKKCISPDGMIWISWPKGTSKVETDLNENIVRDIGLTNGMVDVKVCAIDEVWSGLKFVLRLKDRPAHG